MKIISNRVFALFLAILLCFSTLFIVPTYASGVIDITSGSGGITITPGTAPDMTNVDYTTVGDTVITKGKTIAQTITAVCSLICMVALIISITNLATSGSNPMLRRKALIGILWSGVALSLFGGVWVVVSFFWNFLN